MNSHLTTLTTLLTLPPDLIERDRVRRQALRAGALEHPGLARLRTAAFAGDGLALTWEIPAGSRGVSDGDDVLAVLAPVAAGLALLHDAGLAHGGITSDAVHVWSGRGILTGWRPGGSAPDDVARLAALLESWLPSASVGGDLVPILIAGCDPDAAARPTMARLAAAIEAAGRHSSFMPPPSPPAQRRARVEDAVPMPASDRKGAGGPTVRSIPVADTMRDASDGPVRRGRHAASGGSAARARSPLRSRRLPWRWGVALAGTAAAAFLGLSALGGVGSAQQVCPAPLDQGAWSSLVQRGLPG